MESKQELKSHQLKRYLYIIEKIKDVIWEMTGDFVFTFVSPNAKDMTGYEAEELVGHKMTDFLTEESKNFFYNKALHRVKKRINGDKEEITLYDVQFVCKNGLTKWMEVSAKPMFEEEKFIGYIGTTRDITEKKVQEYELSKYIEELKVSNEKLEKTAITDILTEAYNRRKFEEDLDLLFNSTEKYGNIFSLIFFDIDHFKTVNDRFGHKVGDKVLQSISKLIRDNIKETDSLYRWGGEEFIILLTEEILESAKIIAEEIRNIIQNFDFGMGHQITISLGVAEYTPGEDIDQIIIRLDNALFEAKSRGRNRVISC
ncbi:sensor domain-containing diguanylate cyclase [Desulfitobacterium sp. AusDCA]|uniref:sensor domain-containing diguanylate cyclase n=1 Tax=Desulfitobacterium sp. AusDCA TaxID=3240383 RepID=UPI003DA76333